MANPLRYRSKRRDEPRTITPLSDIDASNLKCDVGEFPYSLNSASFSKIYEEAKSHNKKAFSKSHPEESRIIVECVNDLYSLASKYLWVIYRWPDGQPNPAQAVLFPCFHKTLLSLYSSYDLTMNGLYGPARPHLRHAFESLIIAKFCSINHESDVFDKWMDGRELYFTNAVIKKITHPDTEEFKTVWNLLSDWTHSTIYAGQVDLSLEEAQKEASLNFSFLAVFLQWSYHLLGQHIITPTIRYHGDQYGKSKIGDIAKNRIKENFKWQLQFLGPASLRLIKDYKASWRVQQT